MRYIWQHIHTIIETYKGNVPLTHYLKAYFKQYPKLGSRDRRILSEMAYAWYRCKKGLAQSEGIDDKIKACLFLSGSNQKQIQTFLPEEWQMKAGMSLTEKLKWLADKGISFDIEELFPYSTGVSEGISKEAWLSSMLMQPRLFIRVRKEKQQVVKLLKEQHIDFTEINETCLSLPNGSNIDKILPEDWYAVQDASSQKTGEYFEPKKNEVWYDCCSGAGGKSLLLKDLEPSVKLSVSDKRDSILHNLKQRFKLYHFGSPTSYVTDVSDKIKLAQALGRQQFDNIICDAPCSGSGTWARTPEQLYFFDEESIEKFSLLQQRIAINVAAYLKPGGRLIYITCSVFEKENENVINQVVKNTGLHIEKMQLINGLDIQADSMFIAVLKKA